MKKVLKKRVEELRKAVNEFDSLYGFNPTPKKEKKNKIKYKSLYGSSIYHFELFLKEMICEINGIDKTEYFYIDESGVNAYDIEFDKRFRSLSCIDWKDKTKRDINSIQFKARFTTRFLFTILDNSDRIVKNIYKNIKDDESKKYYQCMNILNQFIKRISLFVATYLSDQYKYSNKLYDIFEMMVLSDGDRYKAEIIKIYNEQSKSLNEAIKDKQDDDIIINNLLQLGYLMSTENKKLKKTPSYIDGLELKDKELIHEQLGRLGYSILHRRMKNELDPPMIYDIWQKCHPLYYSRYDDMNDNLELNIGAKSLEYLKFLIDDRDTTKYIENLIMN